MFDPTLPPYVPAQNYVDANPPAVLADEFYNPTQDSIARIYGGLSGYSTSLCNEEFLLPQPTVIPAIGDPFGVELSCFNNPGASFEFQSVSATAAGMHGVYRIDGVAAGDRGAGIDGFGVADNQRNVGQLRWIFRSRVRCSKFSTIKTAPPGLVFGLGPINAGQPLPSWIADGTGFWTTFWDGGATVTAIPTVDGQWVDLWIAQKNGDGVVRWYLKRDADPIPLLLDTQTLTTKTIAAAKRYFRYLVNNTAVAGDYIEIDNISLGCER